MTSMRTHNIRPLRGYLKDKYIKPLTLHALNGFPLNKCLRLCFHFNPWPSECPLLMNTSSLYNYLADVCVENYASSQPSTVHLEELLILSELYFE